MTLQQRAAEMRAEGRTEEQIKSLMEAAAGVGNAKQQKATLDRMEREIKTVINHIVAYELSLAKAVDSSGRDGPLTEREDREAVKDRPGRATLAPGGIPPVVQSEIVVRASKAAHKLISQAMERVDHERRADLQLSLSAVFASLDQLAADAQAEPGGTPQA